jgi:hypothetical protein
MIAVREYTAGSGGLTTCRIVKPGASNVAVLQASAATDKLIGVHLGPGTVAEAAQGQVCLLGECRLEVSGTVNRGDLITSDADGKGITAAPSAGSNVRTIGWCMQTTTNGVARVFVTPGVMQG